MSFLKKLAKGVSNVVSKATGIAAKLIPGPNPLLEGASAVTGKIASAIKDKGKVSEAVASVSSLVLSGSSIGSKAGSAGVGAAALNTSAVMAKAQNAAFNDTTTTGGTEPKQKMSGGLIAGIVGGVVVVVGLLFWLFTRKKRK